MSDIPSDILRYVDVSSVDDSEFTAQERAILDKINQRVAAAESLPEIIRFLLHSTRAISPCDRIGLAFFEEDGRRVVSYHSQALYEPLHLKPGYTEDMQGSSLQTVLERGVPRIINDLEAYLERRPDSRSSRLLMREGVRSSMTCPLRVDDRIVGLWFRSSRRPRAYDDHQVMLHQAVAGRLSQAIEKVYRIEQLTAANQAYTEMLGFVSHELKSPVAAIVSNARLLEKGYLGELEDKQSDMIGRMIGKGEYLLGLIGEYLDLARIESGEMTADVRENVDFIREVVDPAVQIVESEIESKAMKLLRVGCDSPVTVTCDPDLLKIVLVNLLGNAVKYGNEGGEIRLTVEHDGKHLHVSVWNEGPGFPREQRARLFRRFSRLDTPELKQQKGTGVGLYTCWRIIQAHHGRIDAKSEHGQWADFSFEIPQPVPSGQQSDAGSS